MYVCTTYLCMILLVELMPTYKADICDNFPSNFHIIPQQCCIANYACHSPYIITSGPPHDAV